MNERKHNLCIMTENGYQETCNIQFKNIKRNLHSIQLLTLSLDTSIHDNILRSLTCQIVMLFHIFRNHYNFNNFKV